MTIENEHSPTVNVLSISAGVELEYPSSQGGLATVVLSRVPNNDQYEAAATQIGMTCASGRMACGQGAGNTGDTP